MVVVVMMVEWCWWWSSRFADQNLVPVRGDGGTGGGRRTFKRLPLALGPVLELVEQQGRKLEPAREPLPTGNEPPRAGWKRNRSGPTGVKPPIQANGSGAGVAGGLGGVGHPRNVVRPEVDGEVRVREKNEKRKKIEGKSDIREGPDRERREGR